VASLALVCCRVLQSVAVNCGVLRFVVVCCGVMQYDMTMSGFFLILHVDVDDVRVFFFFLTPQLAPLLLAVLCSGDERYD